MPEDILSILRQLEALARYEGPWRPLRDETALLRERVKELSERESRLDDLLVVALIGGSGVGKSTLLNAIAGDQLARTSEFRPCTSVPTVYQPPGARLDLGHADWVRVSGSALENLVIIDTPDSDTIVREHRRTVQEALAKCDLIIICASAEKYLDEATWSLLRPLQGERTMVCVETKARDSATAIRNHWLARLKEQGFPITDYFRLNALHTLDRKLDGHVEASPDELDWPRLDVFLQHELSRERIMRIKRSNAVGLLRKTLTRLRDRVAGRVKELEAAAGRLEELDRETTRGAHEILAQRLFAEPHLWAFAQGREISLRAKGVVGTLYRMLEALRGLPMRMSAWLPGLGGARRQAVELLADKRLLNEASLLHFSEIETLYEAKRSELDLVLARAGFDMDDGNGFAEFEARLRERTSAVLRGPAHDRLVHRARVFTSWPMTLLADALPLAFLVSTAYELIRQYFENIVPRGVALVQLLVVFAVIVGSELLLLSLGTRLSAWSVRLGALRDLNATLNARGEAFRPERAALTQAAALAQEVGRLETTVARATLPALREEENSGL